MMGLVSLFMKRDRSSLILCHVTTQQEGGHLQGGEMVSPGTKSVSTLVLDFHPTELRINVFGEAPQAVVFLRQPKPT